MHYGTILIPEYKNKLIKIGNIGMKSSCSAPARDMGVKLVTKFGHALGATVVVFFLFFCLSTVYKSYFGYYLGCQRSNSITSLINT